MSDPKSYMDIGHGNDCDHSGIWLCSNDRISYRSARRGTHESVWGQAAMKFWRGRLDTKTKQVSIANPEGVVGDAPSFLIAALKTIFGNDVEIWQFNPARRIET